MQHLKRSALATTIDKIAHIAESIYPSLDDFSWTVNDENWVPIQTTEPLWPNEKTQSVSCKCKKGCKMNCSCGKKNVPCYIGCQWTGSVDKCSRAEILSQIESDESDEHDTSDEDQNGVLLVIYDISHIWIAKYVIANW